MSEAKKANRSENAGKKDKAAKNNTNATTKVKNKNELKVVADKNTAVKKVETKAKKTSPEKTSNPFDKVLWLVSFLLIAVAIGGNYYYSRYVLIDETSLARLGRVAAVIAIIVAGLATALFTTKGKNFLKFGRESYVELRKVIWPTRQEAVQTTFIVFIAVSVVSLFLYLCDLVFLQIVRVITL